MEEDIRTLPLPAELKSLLVACGLCLVRHCLLAPPAELSARLGGRPLDFCRSVQLQIRAAVQGGGGRLPDTAETLLRDAAAERSVPTMSARADRLLRGGLAMCQLTELAGSAGAGKTQLCMQLCAAVQIPCALGGLQGGAVFLDTEGSFSPQRQAQIAGGLLLHLRRLADGMRLPGWRELPQDHLQALREVSSLTVEHVMSNIYYFRCLSHVQLTTFAHESLEQFLTSHPHVRLIVLDSIASPFRYDFEDDAPRRNRQLADLAGLLARLAVTCKLAVLVTNQMTTRFLPGGQAARTEPALGPSWCHVCNIRLVIERLTTGDAAASAVDTRRRIRVLKHPAVQAGSCADCQVCAVGIRDVFEDDCE